MKSIVFFILFSLCILLPDTNNVLKAQSVQLVEDEEQIYKALILEIVSDKEIDLPGLSIKSRVQEIEIEILSGDKKGKIVNLINDYVAFEKGDTLFVKYVKRAEDGKEFYQVSEPNRLPILLILFIFFIVLTVFFGGRQGVRGLISLLGSLFLIFYLLLPLILAGHSPVLVSIGVSALIIIIGSYVTHGLNRVTTSAVIGMIITVIFTGVLSYVVVDKAMFTGFDNEASVYLNLKTSGTINLSGLLLGGIMIGLLGVLYDASIGQAVAVDELSRIGRHLKKSYIYKRAIRMGREHIGALVDTLAIAYVGAGLPLLLLVYTIPDLNILILNREIFSVEIVRTLIGSIGLILAVPITTLVSTFILIKKDSRSSKLSDLSTQPESSVSAHILEKEKKEIEEIFSGSHSHIHNHNHDHG